MPHHPADRPPDRAQAGPVPLWAPAAAGSMPGPAAGPPVRRPGRRCAQPVCRRCWARWRAAARALRLRWGVMPYSAGVLVVSSPWNLWMARSRPRLMRGRLRARMAARVWVLVPSWPARKPVGQPCSASSCRHTALAWAGISPGWRRRPDTPARGTPKIASAVVRWTGGCRSAGKRRRRRTSVTETPESAAMSPADNPASRSRTARAAASAAGTLAGRPA